MIEKTLVLFICVEAIIFLLLYNLQETAGPNVSFECNIFHQCVNLTFFCKNVQYCFQN